MLDMLDILNMNSIEIRRKTWEELRWILGRLTYEQYFVLLLWRIIILLSVE